MRSNLELFQIKEQTEFRLNIKQRENKNSLPSVRVGCLKLKTALIIF